ncbi:MAG: Nicotinamide-nucleotide amidohydrolase PncC [Phycisphaerae bacterium]|nr:Nicotinamide-nucleotide amidohydrolase PncC [Phycisphaerae bacterium]
MSDVEQLVQRVAGRLLESSRTVATAESCTGGLLSKLLTDIPGSSRYFPGGIIAYSNQAKIDLLGVSPELIAQHGAVSAEVAEAMARGARRCFGSDYAISITGIAGPDGGTAAKPVGTVFVALADASLCASCKNQFDARHQRDGIRVDAVVSALQMLAEASGRGILR